MCIRDSLILASNVFAHSDNLKVMGATAGQTRWILMPQDYSNIESIKSFALNSVDKKLDGYKTVFDFLTCCISCFKYLSTGKTIELKTKKDTINLKKIINNLDIKPIKKMVIKKVIVISRINIIRTIPQIIRIVFPIFLGRYPKKYLSKKFTSFS